MKEFLAIDFGTTQTSIARLKENSTREPEIIQIKDSSQKTAKAVATTLQLDDNKSIAYFGEKAIAKAEEAPEKTFQNFKVFVGKNPREYQSETEQNEYTPEDLALLYLRELRERIEEQDFNGAKFSEDPELTCIIGCPADFNEVQKRKLKNIAGEAGFPNPKLCDEPIGVIYYNYFFGGLQLRSSSLQNVLVYDFGGGTTDVAIAKVRVLDNGKIEPSVLSVSGLPDLGGRNFDEVISAHYLNINHYDLSVLSKKDRLHEKFVIGFAARQAKEKLSRRYHVEEHISRLKITERLKPQKLSLSQDDFATICAELISKFATPIYNALTLAGLSVDDIDVVILAGGSSAMPYVLERINKIFSPRRTKILVSSEIEIIAQGLAVWGRAEASGLKGTVKIKNKNDYVYQEPRFSESADGKKKIRSETQTAKEPQNNLMSDYFRNEKAKSRTSEEKISAKSQIQTIKLPNWFEPLWGILYGLTIINFLVGFQFSIGIDSLDKMLFCMLTVFRGVGVTSWLCKHRQSVFMRNLIFIVCLADMVLCAVVFPLEQFFPLEIGSILFLMWIYFFKSNIVGVILGGIIGLQLMVNTSIPMIDLIDSSLFGLFVLAAAITSLFVAVSFFYDSFITWKNLKQKRGYKAENI